jgi:hypothetical protein
MKSAPYNPNKNNIFSSQLKKIFTYIGSSLFIIRYMLPKSETFYFLSNKFEGLQFAVNKSEGKNNFKIARFILAVFIV